MVGRPRKSTARRYPNGQPVREPREDDLGTEEEQARKRRVFGAKARHRELSCPVDVLEAQGRLTTCQHRAGRIARDTFARYCIAINAPRVVSGPLEDFVEGRMIPAEPMNAKACVREYDEMMQFVRTWVVGHYRTLVINPEALAYSIQRELERVMRGSMPRNLLSLKLALNAVMELHKIEEPEEKKQRAAA